MANENDSFEEFGRKLDDKVKGLKDRVEKEVGDLSNEVKGLDKMVVGLATDIKILDSEVKGLDKKVDSLTSDVKGLSTQVSSLGNSVDALGFRVGGLEGKFDSLKNDFATQLETVVGRLVDKIDASSSKSVSSSWRISITVGAFVVGLLGLSFYGVVQNQNDSFTQKIVQNPLENASTQALLREIIRSEISAIQPPKQPVSVAEKEDSVPTK